MAWIEMFNISDANSSAWECQPLPGPELPFSPRRWHDGNAVFSEPGNVSAPVGDGSTPTSAHSRCFAAPVAPVCAPGTGILPQGACLPRRVS